MKVIWKVVLLTAILQANGVFAELDAIAANPPMVSATSWLIAWDEVPVASRSPGEVRQIASLSKLMTALILSDMLNNQMLSLQDIVAVSDRAARLPGTSANLQAGDRLTLEDLLFGMLLPSGNDAALALAEHAARRLPADGRPLLKRFVDAMNARARDMGMQSTVFFDVHGMGANHSTAEDLLLLARASMADRLVSQAAGTRTYESGIKTARGDVRVQRWSNTNQLLGDFDGLKTGHTLSAGGCLVLTGSLKEQRLYVIVLDSQNRETRFSDAFNLAHWLLASMGTAAVVDRQ